MNEDAARARKSGADLFRRVFDLESSDNPTPEEGSRRPVVRLCDLILREAMLNNATQIRLAEYDTASGSVEYLTGLEWRTVMKVPVQAHRPLINRLKMMASLDIGRVPQQHGEIHVRWQGATRILAISVQALESGSDIAVLKLEGASS